MILHWRCFSEHHAFSLNIYPSAPITYAEKMRRSPLNSSLAPLITILLALGTQSGVSIGPGLRGVLAGRISAKLASVVNTLAVTTFM